jgi:uncharacterized protein (DUF2062 family)
MSALTKSILLFVLNWLDGQLTLIWVRANIATEGNTLMGQLLTLGDAPFLFTKLAVGAFAAYVLFRCSHFAIARRGMQLVLAIYFAVMAAHAATGLSALGWHGPAAMVHFLGTLPSAVLALFS